jgi:phosphopantetheine adenylyltransferase
MASALPVVLSALTAAATNAARFGAQVAAAIASDPAVMAEHRPIVALMCVEDAPADAVVAQLGALYGAASAVNPFANAVVVPSVAAGAAAAGAAVGAALGDDATAPAPLVPALPRPVLPADLPASRGFALYDYVALGGTFDRLHAGHKLLLTRAALATGRRLRVGVTGPALLAAKKNAALLQPFDVRCAAATAFLRALRPDLALEVVELTERSGGTNAIADVSAMVVSPETLPSLESINAERRAKGFADMAAVVIPFVGGDTNEARISSSKLRELELAARAAASAPR